jgi:hypothetical protein
LSVIALGIYLSKKGDYIVAMNKFFDRGLFGYNYRHVVTHFWIIPGEAYRRVKWFVQRGWRGYSDRDTWSIDWFLMRILPNMIDELRKNTHGCPVDLTPEKWDEILATIATGFRANMRLMDLDYDPENPIQKKCLTEQSDKAFRLFVRHFHSLWD